MWEGKYRWDSIDQWEDMTEVVKLDEKGRILIPKSIRERTEIKRGSYVKITEREKSILIEPLEPVADKYYGAFQIDRWPNDLDEFIAEVMKEWWKPKST